MTRLFTLISVLLISVGLSGCFYAGQWDGDPKNWKRAFGQPLPTEVSVSKSRYWRSPHFTYEAEYFFEFAAPDVFVQKWIKHARLEARMVSAESIPSYFEKPSWFTPGDMSYYEMWVPSDNAHSKFRIFRHRTKRIWYVTDCST